MSLEEYMSDVDRKAEAISALERAVVEAAVAWYRGKTGEDADTTLAYAVDALLKQRGAAHAR